ncbi:Transposon TX1 uncharacterized protein [Glycine soja]
MVDIQEVKCTAQLIHCKVYDATGNFMEWLTAIYGFNYLEQRRDLWHDLEAINKTQQGPWCLIGDFNNVLKTNDRVGGKMVCEKEYKDLRTMMDNTGLAEMDSKGDYYTWSNKQSENIIYSRIDRILGNTEWFSKNLNLSLTNMTPGISDHAMLCLRDDSVPVKRKARFKYANCVSGMDNFTETVANSWNSTRREGPPMKMLWHKLKKLQPVINNLSKPLIGIKVKLQEAREKLTHAQMELTLDRLNKDKIGRTKDCTEAVIKWTEMEEQMLQQRAKIRWLRLGDGNNAYFHASLKAKYNQTSIKKLYMNDGNFVTTQKEIEDEIMRFYGDLMGREEPNLDSVDINIMRKGCQLNFDQRKYLIGRITDEEIDKALKSIGDLKAPGIDGYGAKFFKDAWSIIKNDFTNAIREFFEKGKIGDKISVDILMQAFMNFSKSTGLVINPSKCKVYIGAMESCIKEEIKHITAFQEGSLPFRYLGVPLTGKKLSDVSSRVPWRELFFSNLARPRAKFVFWTACHGRLATKVRMMKFGLLSDSKCNFCDHLETIDHLLFECAEMKDVWIQILEWQKINHQPKKWIEELSWAMAQGKGKGHRATLLKTALTETVYELWKYRNEVSFGGIVNNTHIGKKIMDSIVYRSWTHKKMREYIARLLIS